MQYRRDSAINRASCAGLALTYIKAFARKADDTGKMARRSEKLVSWAAAGAVAAVVLSVFTFLLPSKLGGYGAWTDAHLVLHNLAAILTRVVVFAMAGAALAGAWHRLRRDR